MGWRNEGRHASPTGSAVGFGFLSGQFDFGERIGALLDFRLLGGQRDGLGNLLHALLELFFRFRCEGLLVFLLVNAGISDRNSVTFKVGSGVYSFKAGSSDLVAAAKASPDPGQGQPSNK